MRILKKLTAVFLLCSMLAGIAAAELPVFSDVGENDAAKEYISKLAEKKIIEGYGNGKFGYYDTITREQFITLLWRADELKKSEAEAGITDIAAGAYYEEAVKWAYENGIAKIYSDKSFGVGKAVDREHAAYFMYNWAKLTGKCRANTGVLLDDYADATEISKDSVTAVAWAVSEGIIFDADEKNLFPKKSITRGEAAAAIGKLLEKHICVWSGWTDNGDGTCARICASDAKHTEKNPHKWNDGELTKKAESNKNGEITYTCTLCRKTKKEVAPAGSKITTRGDVEEAVVATALAYYVKNPYVQYDSTYLSELFPYVGGTSRLSTLTPPEEATSDKCLYSVCSDYAYQCYYEGAGMEILWEGTRRPLGLTTTEAFRTGDNQEYTQTCDSKVNEPITDRDMDAAQLRWINFDKYKESYESNTQLFTGYGLFESGSFTDYTTGLTFKDDGFEGETHYSYYDAEGNLLTPDEAREKYLYPHLENRDEVMRPGDFIVTNLHALLYVGNGRILDCSGYKIDTKTGIDKEEANGAVQAIRIHPYPFNSKNISSVIHLRPLDFFVEEGYDDDPGNDIVKNVSIPEKAKSRIKYPAMSIDRTVDITSYGTALYGGELTYKIVVANETDRLATSVSKITEDIIYDEIYNADHSKVVYSGIKVTETIPEGTELVEGSIIGGGEYKNGVITWSLDDIKSGEKRSFGYKVKVTADPGSVIVNDGGMVDNIPSNVIKNTVGGEKLNAIPSIEESELPELGTNTDFAENILKKAGEDTKLPSAEDILRNLFRINPLMPENSLLMSTEKYVKQTNMFEFKDEPAPEYESIKAMLIDGVWGGRRFYAGEENKWNYADNCIKEIRKEYLETGDIIIWATAKNRTLTGMTSDFSVITVMVYDGEKLLSAKATDGKTEYIIYENVEEELTKLFMADKDIFIALRPSQAR
ncbi:MAG: S-layer homology domain-containing protein [Ruminococcaceae bacterium]|nr:S-layer homology domain-containing protein [Oscillospiraceae bacterium]